MCSRHDIGDATRAYRWSWWAVVLGVAGLLFVAFTPRLLAYMTVERFNLDANHFWIALAVLALSLWTATASKAGKSKGSLAKKLAAIQYVLTAIVVICGILMLLRGSWIEWLSRFAYTGFDLGLTLMAAVSVILVLMLLAARRYNATEKGSPAAF